jgi:soluble lytic murein transglycosylase-like protein
MILGHGPKGCGKIGRYCFRLAFLGFVFVHVFAMAETVGLASQPQRSPYQLQATGNDVYRLNTGYRAPVAVIEEMSALTRLPYSSEIAAAAKSSNLDPALVHAVISVESGHRQDAVSPKGAVGLMQLMPGTALRYGASLPGKSHEENLRAGTRYLRDLLNMFENRLDLALAAYNAGEGAVQKYGNRIPPYRETQNYVPSVLEKYKEWRLPEPTVPQPIVYLPGTRLDRTMIQDSLMPRAE